MLNSKRLARWHGGSHFFFMPRTSLKCFNGRAVCTPYKGIITLEQDNFVTFHYFRAQIYMVPHQGYLLRRAFNLILAIENIRQFVDLYYQKLPTIVVALKGHYIKLHNNE